MAQSNPQRLGRGLATLIGTERRATRAAVEHLRPGTGNPRRNFDEGELEELARSIAGHGIAQPILVREAQGEAGRYEIIAGERRWRAAQRAGLHEVPIVVREAGDREALELALVENVQRSDLGALEEAEGYRQLIENHEYTQSDLANAVGKSRSHVANTLRLLKLPKSVRELLDSRKLSAGHARALLGAEDAEGLADRIARGNLSVRQAEAMAQERPASGKRASDSGKKPKSVDAKAFERKLEEALGFRVRLSQGEGESGELRIRYRSLEQLDELARRLIG